MDENKNIENKIKESFERLNKSARTDLWDKLSGKLSVSPIDESIDAKIKNGFENISKALPPRVWGSVNRQLNIDRVWKRISAELDRRPVIIYWRKLGGIAALLLLLLGGSIYLFKHKRFQPEYNQQYINKDQQQNKLSVFSNEKKSAVKNGITPKSTALAHKQNANPLVNTNSGFKFNPQQYNPNNSIRNLSTAKKMIDKNSDNLVQTHSQELSDSLPVIMLQSITTSLIENNIVHEPILSALTSSNFIPTDTTAVRKKRFEFGITYSYNNTWIINNDTRKSFDENSLIQTVPAWSASYGIVANYNIFSNSSVSAEFFVNSKYTQRYDEFVEGVFNRKTTEFNYYKLALLYQFNINQSPYRLVPSKYTFKAGFYGSYLKNHTHDYTRVLSPKTDTYTKADYGARIAIGQEKTFKRVIIGYGLNAEYGFKNIFEGNRQVPSQFNVSRNALIGGYVNLKYRF